MSKMSNRPLEDVVIEIFLGEGTHSASATVTGDKRPIGMSGPALGAAKSDMSSGFVGGGTWEFDPHTHVSVDSKDGVVTDNRSGAQVVARVFDLARKAPNADRVVHVIVSPLIACSALHFDKQGSTTRAISSILAGVHHPSLLVLWNQD